MLFERFDSLISRQRPRQAPVDGARLTRVGPAAWVADRELLYRSNRLPLRMVVLQDDAGAITLYSPVALDDGTVEALAGLGRVERIIVPNRFHTLFVGRAMDVYPAAELLLPQADAGLGERFARRSRHLAEHAEFVGGLEIRPVRLRSGLDELVLYHDPAECLVVADLFFNLHHASGAARWAYTLNGVWRRPAQSRLQKLLIMKDRQSLACFYRWAMSKPFSQISMAHGQLVTDQARETFYQLFHHYNVG